MAALAIHGRFELWLLKTIVGIKLEVRGRRKDAQGCLPGGLQASIGVGDIRPHSDVPRSGAADEARAVLDPVSRLVLVQVRHDPGRPRQGAERAAPHAARGEEADRGRARDHHLPGRDETRAGRAARLQDRQSPCSTKRSASPACRSRSIRGCSGPGGASGGAPAPSWSNSSTRSRRACQSSSFCSAWPTPSRALPHGFWPKQRPRNRVLGRPLTFECLTGDWRAFYLCSLRFGTPS